MKIIVCIKKIPDPEIPPSKFKLDSGSKQVIPPEGILPVVSPYDVQAVELALRLKEKYGGRITVITLDSAPDPSLIKQALAMGAEEGVVLADPAFEGSDSFSTAYLLCRAIEKIGSYDLILCGRQAADWDEGLVGTFVAEKLGLPLVTLAKEVEKEENGLKVKRVTLEGYQVFAVSTPAVVTVSNEVGRPRLPSGWGIISASRALIPVWKAEDLEADPAQFGAGSSRRSLVNLYIPGRVRKCEILKAETAAEAGAILAELLIREGVVETGLR